MCLQDQSYTLTKTNNVVLNKDNPISSTVRVVFAVGFSFFSFALGSFSILSYSLYRCVNCFSVFVLFVGMEIIIIMFKLSHNYIYYIYFVDYKPNSKTVDAQLIDPE